MSQTVHAEYKFIVLDVTSRSTRKEQSVDKKFGLSEAQRRSKHFRGDRFSSMAKTQGSRDIPRLGINFLDFVSRQSRTSNWTSISNEQDSIAASFGAIASYNLSRARAGV
jgi:hypothetical protein